MAVVVLSTSASLVNAQKPEEKSAESFAFPDFTAIQLLGFERKALPMKVYTSSLNLRVEASPTVATLSLEDSQKIYRLTKYPDKTLGCVVMRPDQMRAPLSPLQYLQGTVVKRTPSEPEELNGHKCTVETVDVKTMTGKVVTSKVWRAEDLKGAPLKIESQTEHGKLLAIYRDITLGAPDKALFDPPDKCTPYEKMGQVVEKTE